MSGALWGFENFPDSIVCMQRGSLGDCGEPGRYIMRVRVRGVEVWKYRCTCSCWRFVGRREDSHEGIES